MEVIDMSCVSGNSRGSGGGSSNSSTYGSEESYTSGTLTLNDQKKIMDWYEPTKKWTIAENKYEGNKREVMVVMGNQTVSGLPKVSMIKSGTFTESSGSSNPAKVTVLTTKNANGSLDVQFTRQRTNPRTGNTDTVYNQKVGVSKENHLEVKPGVYAFKNSARINSNEAGRGFTIRDFGK